MDQPKAKDPQKELEIALGELEERVDRLRASYEQYFMGYEKIEPGVQRKDVDRRFVILRKQQIRNTALRFRFNVVTQKFNTYAMYWTRVCRQIEEGTFKRHLAKAERRFGGAGQKHHAIDDSIEVELGDFESEDLDMDAVLAEADAAAEAYARGGQSSDTVPPESRTDPPAEPPLLRPNPLEGRAPDTSFAIVGGRETLDSVSDSEATPASNGVPRTARHVALPPGTKPRILVRRREGEGPPPSAPALPVPASSPQVRPPMGSSPQVRPPMGSSPQVRPPMGSSPGEMRPPMGSTPDRSGPPSSSVIRPAPASSRMEANRPQIRPVGARPGGSPSAGSAGRVPAAASAGSPGRSPAAPPPGSTPRTPVSPMARPAPSGSRLPVPASSPGSAPPDSNEPRPSRRPPPALPSQVSNKKNT